MALFETIIDNNAIVVCKRSKILKVRRFKKIQGHTFKHLVRKMNENV